MYGRFDEDDFDSAYRELDRRYYAGDGAAFAEAGGLITDYMIAHNQGDLDRLFGELTAPDMRLRESVTLSLSGSLGRRVSCQRRGAVDDGVLGAGVAFGHEVAVA